MGLDYSESERQASVLTERQRKLLTAEEDLDLSSDAKRMALRRVRERVQNGILDFRLLATHMDAEDRQRVFDDLLGEGADESEFNIEGGRAVRAALKFLYIGTTEYTTPAGGQALFEEFLESAVEEAEMERGNAVKTVEFSVETEAVLPWERLKSVIEQRGVTPRVKRSLDYHLRYNKENIDVEAARDYLDEYYEIA